MEVVGVTINITVAGTVESFEAHRDDVKAALAVLTGVPTSSITLLVSPASVNVEARFATDQDTNAAGIMQTLTSTTVTTALEPMFTVESVSAPKRIIVAGPSPPSLTPLPADAGSAQSTSDLTAEADTANTSIIIACIIGGVAALAILFVCCLVVRRRRGGADKDVPLAAYPAGVVPKDQPSSPKSPKSPRSPRASGSVTLFDVMIETGGAGGEDEQRTASDPSEDTANDVLNRNPQVHIELPPLPLSASSSRQASTSRSVALTRA